MSNSSHRLAMRFRAGHQRQQQAEQAARERRDRAEAEAWEAQESILDELEDFADMSGFLHISRTAMRLRLRYDGQSLTFLLDRDNPIVHVEAANFAHTAHLEYHPTRQGWQLVTTDRRGRRNSMELYNRGLERLMVRCFEVHPASFDQPQKGEASKDSEDRRRSR